MAECPNCDGGYVVEVVPDCCGNTTSSGECRGDCAVPRQVEAECPTCGGTNEAPNVIDARELRASKRVTPDGTEW